MLELILLFTAFATKHFICDFCLQFPYQYLNKGTYLHPGGLLHAATHGAFTLFIFFIFGISIWWLVAFDFLIHYHIDFLKERALKATGVKQDNALWWIFLGFDQLLHYLTYCYICYVVFI